MPIARRCARFFQRDVATYVRRFAPLELDNQRLCRFTVSPMDKLFMKTTLCTSKFLALIKEGHWEYVDRVNATGAALIVAVTPEEKLILVEQYRIPVHVRTIELPAGIIGDEPGNGGESH